MKILIICQAVKLVQIYIFSESALYWSVWIINNCLLGGEAGKQIPLCGFSLLMMEAVVRNYIRALHMASWFWLSLFACGSHLALDWFLSSSSSVAHCSIPSLSHHHIVFEAICSLLSSSSGNILPVTLGSPSCTDVLRDNQ